MTINSDDPALFNTTLNNEVTLLADPFNFELKTINEILLNGVHYSFLLEEEKQAMEAAFRAEMSRLERDYGP